MSHNKEPLRSSPEEIAEDIAEWKKDMAQRWGREDAWERYAGDSFGEIAGYYGDKEMSRRKRLRKAGVNPFTGEPIEVDLNDPYFSEKSQ